MTQSPPYSPYQADALPPVVARYFDAQDDAQNRQNLSDAFAPDATVTDAGITYEGLDAVRRWLTTVATEYTYTTTLTGQSGDESGHWAVSARLDGNFPGGTADVTYRFVVRLDKIEELVIA